MKSVTFIASSPLDLQAIADAFKGIAAKTFLESEPPAVTVQEGRLEGWFSLHSFPLESSDFEAEEIASLRAIIPEPFCYDVMFRTASDLNRLIAAIDPPEPFLVINIPGLQLSLPEIRRQIAARKDDWFFISAASS